MRIYPLNQEDLKRDLPQNSRQFALDSGILTSVDFESPSRDYTPPHYLTLLFTDLGILTPAGVSDEIIQQYL